MINMVPRNMLEIATATVSIPMPQPEDTKESHQEAVKNFLVNRNSYLKKISSLEYETLTSMICQHNWIRCFQEHFAALALSKCDMGEIVVESLPWWAALNSSVAEDARVREVILAIGLTALETERVQLGFYLHEFLCQIFPISSVSPKYEREQDSLFSGRKQLELLISSLPAEWIESLNCIHQYLMGMVGKIFDRVEDEFVADLVALDIGEQDDSKTFVKNIEAVEVTKGWREKIHEREYLNFEPWHGLLHRQNASYAASLGVDYIYDLVNSAQTERLELARQSMEADREFLIEALEDVYFYIPAGYFLCNKRDGPHVCRYNCERLEDMITMSTAGPGQYFHDRDLAFIFWDSWRIEMDPTLKQLKKPRDYASPKQHYREWPRSGISATERPIDILVRRDELEAVLNKYSPLQDLNREKHVEESRLESLAVEKDADNDDIREAPL